MKRTQLEKKLRAIARDKGVELTSKEGANHTIFNINGTRLSVPRHNEITEFVAQRVLADADKA